MCPRTTNFWFRGISATANGGLTGLSSGSSGDKCGTSGAGCGGGAVGGGVGGTAGTVVVTNTGPIGIIWDWRLVGAAPGTGGFTTTVPMDQVVGRVGAGVQLYTGELADFRLQYDGEFGGNLTAHGGSVVVSVKS